VTNRWAVQEELNRLAGGIHDGLTQHLSCGDAPRAPMQPCKRQVWPPPGSPPAQDRSLPEQAQSEKSQGVRGTESWTESWTESPDSFDNTVKKTENYVSVFSGELQS
jgi:hypothetical protein